MAPATANRERQFGPVLREYERITGFRETNINAFWSRSFAVWPTVPELREAVADATSKIVWGVHDTSSRRLVASLSTNCMAKKDDEIGELLAWLREHVFHDLIAIDHWDADRCAIGIAVPGDPQRLVYISTWQRPSHRYFVELESPPTESSAMPYTRVRGNSSPLIGTDWHKS